VNEGTPLLYYAVYNNKYALAQLLLKYKANPLAYEEWSIFSTIHLAAHHGKLDMVKLLIEHGLDINAAPAISFNNSPLHLAIYYGHIYIINYLIQCGAAPVNPLNGEVCNFSS